MIDARFLEGWCKRFRDEIPGTVAVILKGSHVRGDAGPRSDVDFDVLVADGTEVADPYLTWIEPMAGGRLVHVAAGVETVSGWHEGMAEAAGWSFGLPSQEATRVLWAASEELLTALDRPVQTHPAGDPELEDAMECLGKARNTFERGDELLMRLHLHDMALLVPSLLVAINAPVQPGTRPEALRAVLAFAVAPDGYRDDLMTCLGLSGIGTTATEALAAGTRLVMGTIALLEQHADVVCPLQPPQLDTLLASGVVRRYLQQT